MEWNERVRADREVLGVRPAVGGMRMSVAFILELRAAGSQEGAIWDNRPWLSPADAGAGLGYAREQVAP